MARYIELDALLAEIEKLVDKGKYHEEFDCAYRDGNNNALYALKEKIDTLEVKEVQEYEQPDYSCFETTYKCGKKPHWSVGDTLAYYEFCSDREGEHVLGEVANVRFDEEQSDWIYTFEGDRLYEEEWLLDYEIYKKK